jgi:hypothetical protein
MRRGSDLSTWNHQRSSLQTRSITHSRFFIHSLLRLPYGRHRFGQGFNLLYRPSSQVNAQDAATGVEQRLAVAQGLGVDQHAKGDRTMFLARFIGDHRFGGWGVHQLDEETVAPISFV